MLGWLLLGALMTAAVIYITVSYLNREIAERELKKNNVRKGMVKSIVKSGSVAHIKMDAIKDDGSEVELEIEADDYNAAQIHKGAVIYS